ncbi:MAG: DNA mismatch repair protein MutS, partial [Candidatus Wallbacteria bacterium]|nr:DNA mismatch repair protein MutS [Candidatus Wallbacteria bacterium]
MENTRDIASTPMMDQYRRIKGQYPHSILFFRLGDFYETFFEDAVTVSRELDLVLTSRSKAGNVPLAGIPYHAVDSYLARLIRKGFTVSICEQMEDPKKAKGIVKREVIRTVTPGTVMAENLLEEKSNNFIASVHEDEGMLAIAFCDISTADFSATQFLYNMEKLEAELTRIRPVEILMSDSLSRQKKILSVIRHLNTSVARKPDGTVLTPSQAGELFERHFPKAHEYRGKPAVRKAAGFLLDYLRVTQMSELSFLDRIRFYEESEHMVIDAATFRNLELMESFSGDRTATLRHVLDRTATATGGRLLKKWISFPLLNRDEILRRQDIIAEFCTKPSLIGELQDLLRGTADLERILSRLNVGLTDGRDLVLLKNTLKNLPVIGKMIITEKASDLCSGLEPLPELADLLDRALHESAGRPERGHLIRDGYSPEMDDFKCIVADSKRWLATLEHTERERTGIKALKVRFNKVFGYYIEVTKTNLDRVPQEYIRKQTIAGGERYFTEVLKEKEAVILGSEERIRELEEK